MYWRSVQEGPTMDSITTLSSLTLKESSTLFAGGKLFSNTFHAQLCLAGCLTLPARGGWSATLTSQGCSSTLATLFLKMRGIYT